MHVRHAAVVLTAALACTACAQSVPRARSTQSVGPSHPVTATTVPPIPTTTPTSAPQTATTVPLPATRSFTVSGAVLTSGSWLTVGLHPTTAPVQLTASATTLLEVCPAGLDGGLTDSSWPPWFKFSACLQLSSAGVATLPATDGLTHVAFAIRPVSDVATVALTLTVNYTPTDSFVEVIPPRDGSQTAIAVTYSPGSDTTGALATPVNSIYPAPGYTLVLSQAGRSLSQPAVCDFPSEIACVGGVSPNEPITARLTGPVGSVVLNLAWK